MKQVLIIDASSLFREFLHEKLKAEHIGVEISEGKRDAFTKLISILPDLVIIDILDSIDADIIEFLSKKAKDPNAKSIPLLIAGPEIDKNDIPKLAHFGFIKYFTKPIKYDLLFEYIGSILKTRISIDTTPCILGIHKNQNILFIEIAQGLNREKITILKYKISEILDTTELENPKILIMMTDLDLTFVDGANIELLFNGILQDQRVHRKNVKVLSLSPFIQQMLIGHQEYEGIEMASDLSKLLSNLVDNQSPESLTELISNNILTPTSLDMGSVEMRFHSDSEDTNNVKKKELPKYSIAILDKDKKIQDILSNAFKLKNIKTSVFSTGTEFLKSLTIQNYDLLILELYLPDISGLEIIAKLRTLKNSVPFFIYSSITQRQLVLQAMELGSKTYFIKPQKTNIILKKAMDVLNEKK